MSEVRRDIVTDTWVIIDTDNDEIPNVSADVSTTDGPCPFCEGNEGSTPKEIYAIRDGTPPNSPGWRVRVVPNKNPILKVEGALEKFGVGVYDMVTGTGANEVIIESPRHVTNIADLEPEQIALVLDTYRYRIEDLHKDQRIRYVLIFKNYGRLAGASTISHVHSDLIALPATPNRVKQKLNGAYEYYRYKERCLFCDIIFQEIEMGERLILQTEKFVVFAPYASRFPGEVMVIPKRHTFSYKLIDKSELSDLAYVLKKIFSAIGRGFNNPPYNLILTDSPNLLPRPDYWKTIEQDFHWHMEIIPRIFRTTGFELGTGFYINRYSPEKSAKLIRMHL
ncbi:MAG: HIT domain-containing protein [candidate division WOR-3 bacterium]